MNAARLNFSHGTHESHGRVIKTLRDVATRCGVGIPLIQDLQGPRIRVGTLSPDGIVVEPGQRVRLVTEQAGPRPTQATADNVPSVHPRDPGEIPVTYPNLFQDVKPGAKIFIDDGLIELSATTIVGEAVECRAVTGGRIVSHKGMNLPGTAMSQPTLTDKDIHDLRFGVQHGVDFLALSFVRGPQDIDRVRSVLADLGAPLPVLAKIERAEAVECLDEILEAADGVMVARGDLGVEMGPEVVPILQKRIIAKANQHRRLVVTATQMLESMTRHPQPTRAEASDVANAIFDRTDAVMLSAETSVGQYPVEAVEVMDRIMRAAEEESQGDRRWFPDLGAGTLTVQEGTCAAGAAGAALIGARAIVTFTESGATARLISKLRPAVPVVALTSSEEVRRQLGVYAGVVPLHVPRIPLPDHRPQEAERRLQEEHLVQSGDRIVLVSGTLSGEPGGTHSVKFHQIR